MLRTIFNLCAAIFAIGLMSALSGCAGQGADLARTPPSSTADH
jgi:hypothetical protein